MCVCLYCIVLYCIVLYCIVLYCGVLHCIALHCIARACCTVAADIVGGLDQIRDAMLRYLSNERLQENACRTLGNLAINDTCEAAIVAAGGADWVCKALVACEGCQDVQVRVYVCMYV